MDEKIIIGKFTLESLTSGMYANPRDIFREYIQNSVDSIDAAIKDSLMQQSDAWIKISINNENKSIVFEDNGIGLPVETSLTVLTSIGNSNKCITNNRGFRGIGRLAGLSYCSKLTFETSFSGQPEKTIISYDSEKLKKLLIPGEYIDYNITQVISEVISIEYLPDAEKSHFFKVILEDVENLDGLLDFEEIVHFLSQTAPVPYNSNHFSWVEKINSSLEKYPHINDEYNIIIQTSSESVHLMKPYSDRFIADKFKRIVDEIKDIEILELKDDHNNTLAVIWYSITQFTGSILDEKKRGLRFRKGNILVGDNNTLNVIFKEKRFNGWFQGEVFIVSPKIIPNARRDGFEKNHEYFELIVELENFGNELSRKIRAVSAMRNEKQVKNIPQELETKAVSNTPNGDNDDPSDAEESDITTESVNFESDSKLQLFRNLKNLLQKEDQLTKYAIINSNTRLTVEQKRLLEKVFDAIAENSDTEQTELHIKTILNKI